MWHIYLKFSVEELPTVNLLELRVSRTNSKKRSYELFNDIAGKLGIEKFEK